MRTYTRKYEEPPYTMIESRFHRYVLDMPDLRGSYFERRLKLSDMDTGFRLYPLKERYTTLAQILRSKRKEFIDSDGKLWVLKKTQMYKCKTYAVLHSSVAWNGKTLLYTKAGNYLVDRRYNYVTLIETEKGNILFDLSDEPSNRVRVKI